ncbi:TIGR02996 domain-containing protein [Fimbriiglobus ruber]|uniref:Uncharacterized protein n=1 Tax=Fimbriiglobus ruber TaxID=1908690 RepID=A0A225DZY5_9BACT|nr:TIGR02996 domain-containing protein [Fimbriiglobus ruber]OWK45134.1 hypothetical protein FRUB_01465 [Fimbriiglobus ruber]
MSDHDALLAAVLANPEDDLPRLVFADHLEESGHPANVARAQYIRLQIEAATHPEDSTARHELTVRAAAFRGSFVDEADAILAKSTVGGHVYRYRGFLDEIHTYPRAIAAVGNVLLAVAPLRVLRLANFSKEAGWPENATFLGRLAVLKFGPGAFGYGTSEETIRQQMMDFLTSPNLAGIRVLDLGRNGLNDAAAVSLFAQFADLPCAPGLHVLNLATNSFTDAAANTIAAARGVDNLHKLKLIGNRITRAGIAVLRRRFGDRVEF